MLQILTAKKQLHSFLSLQDVSCHGSGNRFFPVNSSLMLVASPFPAPCRVLYHQPLILAHYPLQDPTAAGVPQAD